MWNLALKNWVLVNIIEELVESIRDFISFVFLKIGSSYNLKSFLTLARLIGMNLDLTFVLLIDTENLGVYD